MEADGCEIRTERFMTAREAQRESEDPDKIVHVVEWREVRTGLVRPQGQVDASYVCESYL